MRTAVQPLSPGPEIVDEAAEDIGLRCLLIARPVQTPAPQRGGRVELHHGAGAGTIDGDGGVGVAAPLALGAELDDLRVPAA